MACGPFKEAIFTNRGCLSMFRIVKLVLSLTQVGVIKLTSIISCYALAHFILILKNNKYNSKYLYIYNHI